MGPAAGEPLQPLSHRQATSSSWSFWAKRKRNRSSPQSGPRPGRKKAEPATEAAPVAVIRWQERTAEA